MDIIKSLFNGDVKIFEDMEYDPEYSVLNRELENLLSKTDEKMPKEDKVFFSDKLRGAFSDIETKLAERAFVKGFALAVQLMMESCNTKI